MWTAGVVPPVQAGSFQSACLELFAVFLKTQPRLKFNYPARQSIGGMAELIRVLDIGRRRSRNERRQVQNDEDVEEVRANCQPRLLS